MTPSEPKPDEVPASANSNAWSEVWLGGKDFPAGGVPDPAVLARIANEFFTALPEFAPVGSSLPAAPAQLPSVPAAAAAPVIPQGVVGITPPVALPAAFPTEADLRALPASLAASSGLSLPAPGAIPSSPLPTIPGDFAALRFSDVPSLLIPRRSSSHLCRSHRFPESRRGLRGHSATVSRKRMARRPRHRSRHQRPRGNQIYRRPAG